MKAPVGIFGKWSVIHVRSNLTIESNKKRTAGLSGNGRNSFESELEHRILRFDIPSVNNILISTVVNLAMGHVVSCRALVDDSVRHLRD